MSFETFRDEITAKFESLQKHSLYETSITRDKLWATYLASFSPEANPIYKERTEHDCTCCRHFIYHIGNIAAVVNGKLETIWDITPSDESYASVAKAMSALVRKGNIVAPYLHYEKHVGVKTSRSLTDGEAKTWNHFHLELPQKLWAQKDQIAPRISNHKSLHDVFLRGLTEISPDALDTVLELVDQNSLYRGAEAKRALEEFKLAQSAFKKARSKHTKEDMLWEYAQTKAFVANLRSTAIGTLLQDLSAGRELEESVAAFERIVAPANYKRSSTLITPAMIKLAKEKVKELGIADALPRRHAKTEDITVNNVIFANRNARKVMTKADPFDMLNENVSVNPSTLKKVEDVTIDHFIKDIVPHATRLELLVENRHTPNLMSLLAPVNPEALGIFKWNNNFSWAYNGDVTDSMKERVKAAGGKVDGVLRFSIQWNDGAEYNSSDYDAHCIEPDGHLIYFADKNNRNTTGSLDVDIRVPEKGEVAVENITWSDATKMRKGEYVFLVHNFSARGSNNGFSAEFECNGEIRSYAYNQKFPNNAKIEILRGNWDGQKFTVTKERPTTLSSKTVWDIPTMQYRDVSMLMHSPNFWDDQKLGNKHWFFILEGCKQPGEVRGFYNEFLTDKLHEHRKVFEVLGANLKAPESPDQLSGLGFSSTQRNNVLCKVTGKVSRVINISF